MEWILTLAVLTGLAILPLGVRAAYDSQGPRVYLMLGPVKWKVFPGKKKREKPPKTKTSQPKQQPKNEEKGGSLKDFLPLVKPILGFLSDFRRKLRVNRLQLKLTLAGGDPAKLAVNYGKTWAAIGNLMPQLERVFVIKKRDVEVLCDFVEAQTLVVAGVDLTITLGRLLWLCIRYGFLLLREYLKIRKLRKGGANV